MATPDPTPIPLSGDPRIDGLLEPANWSTTDAPLVLTWAPYDFGGGHWTTAELATVQAALDSWSAVANIEFVRIVPSGNYRTTTADIAVVATGTRLWEREDASGTAFLPIAGTGVFNLLGNTWNPSTYPRPHGDIFIDDPLSDDFSRGTYGFHVLVHEIGHALGLKHPHDAPPTSRTFAELGIANLDNVNYTVMSYNHPLGDEWSLYEGWPASPMLLDILAIQYLYGPNMSHHTGDDLYEISQEPVYLTIWDAGGVDTLDISLRTSVDVDLRAGAVTWEGDSLVFAIAYGVTIENVITGGYEDVVRGNAAGNLVESGSGDDIVNGYAGWDTLDGGEGSDRLAGGTGGDTLRGADDNDVLIGGQGADISNGGAGDDDIRSGRGSDRVSGGEGNDLVIGGRGHDWLDGGDGADILRGGKGGDTLLFDPADVEFSGGDGVDTLVVQGSLVSVALGWEHQVLSGIEVFELGGNGPNDLLLTTTSILTSGAALGAVTGGLSVELMIYGDADDRVVLDASGWVRGDTIGYGGVSATAYSTANVTVYVETGVSVLTGSGTPRFISVDSLDASDGFTVWGSNSAHLGYVLKAAGDLDGDGFDDFIVNDDAIIGLGNGHGFNVIFGSDSGADVTITMEGIIGADGFRIESLFSPIGYPADASGVGDINGDGFDDLVVGEAGYSGLATRGGAAYVVFGGPDLDESGALELADFAGTPGFRIVSGLAHEYLGVSISSADVNGDGLDDLILGSEEYAYVVFGQAGGFPEEINVQDLNGSNGFRISGFSGPRNVISVASAGDVNGDGIDDLIIGNREGSDVELGAGEVAVIFGVQDWSSADINISSLDGETGFRILGSSYIERFGSSVGTVGDVNGDGLDDVFIWEPNPSGKPLLAGGLFILFGKASGFAAEIHDYEITGATGFVLTGTNQYDGLGMGLGRAGDMNADGYDDLLISTHGASTIPGSEGSVYVVLGGPDLSQGVSLTGLNGANGLEIGSPDQFGDFPSLVEWAGDINGDGLDDILISAIGGSTPDQILAGWVQVIYGFETDYMLS